MSFINLNNTDNYMTAKSTWKAVKQFIPTDKVIWEPFYGNGQSGQFLRELGFNVIHEDEDFFLNNKGDIIVTNPPFSKKKEILKKLKELDKPFMIICPSMMLGYKYFQELFANQIQIIVPTKRISFNHINNLGKIYSPPFGSFYYCYKMNLPKDLLFLC